MAQETIDAIRSAELAAEQKERETEAECKKIIADAQQQGKEIYSKMIRESKEKAQSVLEAARKQGERLAAEAKHQSEQEIEVLRKIAADKEQAAIQMILAELI